MMCSSLRNIIACLGFAILTGGPAGAQDKLTWSTLERGLYLTRLGDCAACHTVTPDKPFAGDFPLETPFGTIYSSNLTPDAETGLGSWSKDDFFKAMNEGIRPDGKRLYPAFPYTHFTYVTRDDADAIFDYLKSLPAVHQEVTAPKFPFPLNERVVMRGWNLLNFEDQVFKPIDGKSDAWNRGYYIAEGLAHCALCHSPKNLIGSEEGGKAAYTGGMADGWFAPPLRPTGSAPGLENWSKEDIMSFLKEGRNDHTGAFGPMRDVIENSTQYFTDDDLTAMAEYLKDIPHGADQQQEPQSASEPTNDPMMALGKTIYDAQCSACHQVDGTGLKAQFARLKGSNIVLSDNPTTIIRLVLEGGIVAATDRFPTPQVMPAFDWKLSDQEVAAVTTYVRNSFGNTAQSVTAEDVSDIRSK